jgi:hypothetical protein
MVIYIIYNADLVDVSQGHPNELTLAFVDDTAFIAIGSSTEKIQEMLQDMLKRAGGGFEWSHNHNSKFETNKFALIDFHAPPRKTKTVPHEHTRYNHQSDAVPQIPRSHHRRMPQLAPTHCLYCRQRHHLRTTTETSSPRLQRPTTIAHVTGIHIHCTPQAPLHR